MLLDVSLLTEISSAMCSWFRPP